MAAGVIVKADCSRPYAWKKYDGVTADLITIAAFDVITSLGLMVMEKQGEVAILQTQGLTPRQDHDLVFMVQGASARYRCDPRSGAWRPACQPVK